MCGGVAPKRQINVPFRGFPAALDRLCPIITGRERYRRTITKPTIRWRQARSTSIRKDGFPWPPSCCHPALPPPHWSAAEPSFCACRHSVSFPSKSCCRSGSSLKTWQNERHWRRIRFSPALRFTCQFNTLTGGHHENPYHAFRHSAAVAPGRFRGNRRARATPRVRCWRGQTQRPGPGRPPACDGIERHTLRTADHRSAGKRHRDRQ